MSRKRHVLTVAGLLGLSCLVQVMVIRRATLTGLDAVRFVDIARSIDQQGLLQTIQTRREQPLFPAWVWAVHEVVQRVGGGSRSAWAASAQLAAAIPLVLAVVPLYLMSLRLVGSAAALAGSFLFCLLPEVSRLGADGISDSTHLLFFCLAFWAMVEYFRSQGSGVRGQGSGVRGQGSGARGQKCLAAGHRPARSRVQGPGLRVQDLKEASGGRPTWLLLAGIATAAAVLARAEALVLAGVLGLAMVAFQFQPARRRAWGSLVAGAGAFVLGLVVVLGPYLAVAGSLAPRAAVGRVLGRHPTEQESSPPIPEGMAGDAASWRLADGEPMSFDAKEPTISIRRRGYPAAVGRFGKKLADAFGYWVGALAVLGAWRLRRRPASAADRFVQIFFVLFSVAAIRFTAAEGYLVPRHLLVLVVAGIASAGYGALELGGRLASRKIAAGAAVQPPNEPRVGQRHDYSPVAWTVVVLAGIACLPQTLMRLHHSRLGHRAAGEWLGAQAELPGAVLDTLGWTGLYSGRRTYPYEDARAALSDPHLAYVVLQRQECDYDSVRSRTLRWLMQTAARPAAEFPDPATRKPNQQPVVVYRWYPDRFHPHLATRPPNLRAREDRHGRTNPGVRR